MWPKTKVAILAGYISHSPKRTARRRLTDLMSIALDIDVHDLESPDRTMMKPAVPN